MWVVVVPVQPPLSVLSDTYRAVMLAHQATTRQSLMD